MAFSNGSKDKPYSKGKAFFRSKEINELKSTKLLRQALPYGIAFHHAGLIPVIKELVEDLFSKGLINILYTTETFAGGINVPGKSVCFESLRKFDAFSRHVDSHCKSVKFPDSRKGW